MLNKIFFGQQIVILSQLSEKTTMVKKLPLIGIVEFHGLNTVNTLKIKLQSLVSTHVKNLATLTARFLKLR